MAVQPSSRQQRPRGSLDPVKRSNLFARVDENAKAKYDAVADAAGVSLAILMEELAKHLELDERGLPVWWSESTPQQEELPLKTA